MCPLSHVPDASRGREAPRNFGVPRPLLPRPLSSGGGWADERVAVGRPGGLADRGTGSGLVSTLHTLGSLCPGSGSIIWRGGWAGSQAGGRAGWWVEEGQ